MIVDRDSPLQGLDAEVERQKTKGQNKKDGLQAVPIVGLLLESEEFIAQAIGDESEEEEGQEDANPGPFGSKRGQLSRKRRVGQGMVDN